MILISLKNLITSPKFYFFILKIDEEIRFAQEKEQAWDRVNQRAQELGYCKDFISSNDSEEGRRERLLLARDYRNKRALKEKEEELIEYVKKILDWEKSQTRVTTQQSTSVLNLLVSQEKSSMPNHQTRKKATGGTKQDSNNRHLSPRNDNDKQSQKNSQQSNPPRSISDTITNAPNRQDSSKNSEITKKLKNYLN